MLVAGEQYLPQYEGAITEAKQRLAGGDLLPTQQWKGLARCS